jgi:hypothetical protein
VDNLLRAYRIVTAGVEETAGVRYAR